MLVNFATVHFCGIFCAEGLGLVSLFLLFFAGVNAAPVYVFRCLSLSTVQTCSSFRECIGRPQGMCTSTVFVVRAYKMIGRVFTVLIDVVGSRYE